MRAAVLLLLASGVLLAACARKAAPPRPAEPAPEVPRVWPQGRTDPLKITDSLTLEIPLAYERAAISQGRNATRAFLSQQSDRSEVQFDFFLPDFSGYTPQNYRNDFDPNRVEVVYLHAGDAHEADPDAPGEYPPNMLKRALRDVLDPNASQELYGLRCYRTRVPSDRLTCYGRRTADEDIMLTTFVPPYPAGVAFPAVQARYFSGRYGGVRIAWRTHAQNLPRWHDIDAHIWKLIGEWDVAPPAADAPPPAAEHPSVAPRQRARPPQVPPPPRPDG